MNNIEIANALIQGSQNIDKMKAEIVQLVRILVGYARKSIVNSNLLHYSHEVPFESGQWTISGWNNGDAVNINVRCWISDAIGPSFEFLQMDEISFGSTENVQTVYDNRDKLVQGFLEIYPPMEKLLQPLINAAPAS